jgi:hypothetical protein
MRYFTLLLLSFFISCQQEKKTEIPKATPKIVLDTTPKTQAVQKEVKQFVDFKLRDLTSLPTQTLVLNPKRDTLIIGKRGTRLFIPAGTFETTKKAVKLELEEYDQFRDIFSADLTTLSDGKLIQSAGMIRLEPKSKSLKFAKGKNITVKFPSKNEGAYRLFYGNGSGATLNWMPASEPNYRDDRSVTSVLNIQTEKELLTSE